MFFNKRFNLCYGYFLKKLDRHKTTILAVKSPSLVKPVNYARLVEDLWKKEISDKKEEDNMIKKTIANTNVGMSEKGINKSQRSFIFTTCKECKYYQAQYGG